MSCTRGRARAAAALLFDPRTERNRLVDPSMRRRTASEPEAAQLPSS